MIYQMHARIHWQPLDLFWFAPLNVNNNKNANSGTFFYFSKKHNLNYSIDSNFPIQSWINVGNLLCERKPPRDSVTFYAMCIFFCSCSKNGMNGSVNILSGMGVKSKQTIGKLWASPWHKRVEQNKLSHSNKTNGRQIFEFVFIHVPLIIAHQKWYKFQRCAIYFWYKNKNKFEIKSNAEQVINKQRDGASGHDHKRRKREKRRRW